VYNSSSSSAKLNPALQQSHGGTKGMFNDFSQQRIKGTRWSGGGTDREKGVRERATEFDLSEGSAAAEGRKAQSLTRRIFRASDKNLNRASQNHGRRMPFGGEKKM